MKGVTEINVYQASCVNCGKYFEEEGNIRCFNDGEELINELNENGWRTDQEIKCSACVKKEKNIKHETTRLR